MKYRTASFFLIILLFTILFFGCDLFDKFPPDEISNLKTVAAETSIFLSWENPDDKDFMEVDIYYSDGTESELFDGYKNSMGTYIQNLSSGIEYTIEIKTIDIRGNVSDGISVSVTTEEGTSDGGGSEVSDTTPPAEVSDFSGIAGNTEITLTWTNPDDEDFDHVEIFFGTPTADTEFTGTIDPSETIISGLLSGTQYSITIKTVDTGGNVSSGETLLVTTAGTDITPPAEVSNFSGIAGNTEITLTWTNPTDADFEHVEIFYGSPSADTEFTGTIDSAGTVVGGLTENQSYSFTIKTVDQNGNVSNGETIMVTTTETDTTPPAEVSSFSGIAGIIDVTLSWTNPTDADFDHVEITYGSSTADTEYIGIINPSGTVISALNVETDYLFHIKTVDTTGNTSDGVILTVSTLAYPGAVKIVNSWGTGGWENKTDGHYWVDLGSLLSLQPIVYFYENNFDSAYEPRMLAVFQVDHPYRDEALIEIGVGDPVSPDAVKHFQSDWGGTGWGSIIYSGNLAFTDSNDQLITMAMDISELIPVIHGSTPENDVFLRITNEGSVSGTLNSFSVEYYSDYSQPPFKTITGQTGSFGAGETTFTANTADALTSAEEFLITPLSRSSSFSEPVLLSEYPSEDELSDDMERYGVYEEGRNYNIISESGFGTGDAPPTLDEWQSMKKLTDVEPPINVSETPDTVDNSATIWFPPVGNQGGEGSCTAFAVGYYIHTYNEAREHGWDLTGADWEGGYSGAPSVAYQDRIMSPDFFYHQVNSGADNGSSHMVVAELAVRIGGASWETMPYDYNDHTSWPDEEAFRSAATHRGRIPETFASSDITIYSSYASCGYFTLDTPEAIELLKEILAAGYCVSTSVNASDGGLYDLLDSVDVVSGYTGGSMSTNHANTIVGYKDDSIWDPANPDS